MADENEAQIFTEEKMPVESLVQGRSKRSTAGRHMSALLDAAADDDLALLFEEVDDDNEFSENAEEDGVEDDDMGLESSDDDEDQGPDARADDDEGEQQLQKEEKAEKKKRRAQQDLRFKITSKKVKIDPTAVSTIPAPRPKKKSERISWIPTPEEGPTRSSSRRQTMQNKELTHARLKDSEEKRIRLIATMEEAAKRKAHLKPKEMTQAERLAEAERVERQNSKSLNRWEEMEKRKAEERQAKIKALQNRRLEGPVMSYWSGVATWVDGRLTRVGKVDITAKPEKEDNSRKKIKKTDKEGKIVAEQKPADNTTSEPVTTESVPPRSSEGAVEPNVPSQEQAPEKTHDHTQTQEAGPNATETISSKSEVVTNGDGPDASAVLEQPLVPSVDEPAQAPNTGIVADHTSLKDKIEPSAKTPEDIKMGDTSKEEQVSPSSARGKSENLVEDHIPAIQDTETPNDVPNTNPSEPKKDNALSSEEPATDLSKEPVVDTTTQSVPEVNKVPETTTPAPELLNQPRESSPEREQQQVTPEVHVDQPATMNETIQPEVPQHPPVVEHMGRTLTVLENFDDKTAQSREFNIYFNTKKPPRLTKISSSLCVITSLPSRYRDPETSLPFANAYAYNEIRNTVDQKYTWSAMLGCYVGSAGVAAQGVPERFLDPNAQPPPKVSEKESIGSEPSSINKKKPGETKASGNVPKASTPAKAATLTPTPVPVENNTGDTMDID
ncbi:YL1 nuclear protein-domain-containing protein [Aspergillus avenaceus]|uniref:YL1 nuclear protein-domain-containing protein n=1 Tax=Aspergillus avenaceus TaxID=36643 RepID=A0A5N6U847_ASPAV|nr:YL1 nuclear protein-domain-containing protein [Aspergillus avenaceus]